MSSSPSSSGKRRSQELVVNRLKEITCTRCGHKVNISRAKPLSVMACPQCGADVRVPCQIGHFLLVKKLGQGTMGAVYQAYDENLWRQVALKVIFKASEAGDTLYEDCLREARAMASINHPNVAQVYELSEDMGQPYMVLELLDGGRFDQLLSTAERKLDQARALQVGRDVAQGLAAVNRLGLIHGDIKPENILLHRDGTAKLVDFGLAIRFRQFEPDGKVRGTPYYVAPEIARGQKPDPRADVYSLGSTLFHALAGRPPFQGKTAVEVILARLKQAPPDLRDFRPDLHLATLGLIQGMIDPDPARRHETMAALIDDFQATLAAVG